MTKSLASRLLSVLLLAIPGAFLARAAELHKAVFLARGPTEQAAYLSYLQTYGLVRGFLTVLVEGLVFITLVELLAFGLRGGWRQDSAAA